MRLSGFTPSGTVKILFSESIVITTSNSRASAEYNSTFINEIKKTILKVKYTSGLGPDTPITAKLIGWNITLFSEDELIIQLDFENVLYVNLAEDKDLLTI